jgi:hypothetical protein
MALNEGLSPNFRGVRVALGAGYNRGGGNRRVPLLGDTGRRLIE